MKEYLLLSDSHGDLKRTSQIFEEAEELDAAILYSGDFGPELESSKAINLFESLDCDLYFVPGSHDSRNGYLRLEKLAKNRENLHPIHKKSENSVLGCGGSPELGELLEAYQYSQEFGQLVQESLFFVERPSIKELNELFWHWEPEIFLTHKPPYGYADKTSFKFKEDYVIHASPDENALIKHRGDMAFRLVVETHKPKLTACGHFHEIQYGYNEEGKLRDERFAGAFDLDGRVLQPGDKVDSLIINPGPAFRGLFALAKVKKRATYCGHFII